jgi:hypothetical protein
MTPTFKTPTPEDLDAIAADIRPADAEELRIGCWGLPPRQALAASLACSDFSIVALALTPAPSGTSTTHAAIFGIRADSILDRSAIIWMIGTRALDRLPRALARSSRPCLSTLAATLPWAETFRNAVPSSHETTLRWLSWLGAYFSHSIRVPDPDRPHTYIPFTPFTIERSAICATP